MDLFYRGGTLFMGLLSIILLMVVLNSFRIWYLIIKGKISNLSGISSDLRRTKELGLLAFILGILGQLISLFSAFKSIQLGSVEVSSSIIYDGFQISMITTIYGLLICAVALIFYRGSVSFLVKDE